MSDSKSESDIAAAPPDSATATATTAADSLDAAADAAEATNAADATDANLDAAGYIEASSNVSEAKKQFTEYPGDEKPLAEHSVDWEKGNVKSVV
ncbi:hypothetical protein GGI20_005352, partial [Coemansia sp. BCRC 34301]